MCAIIKNILFHCRPAEHLEHNEEAEDPVGNVSSDIQNPAE